MGAFAGEDENEPSLVSVGAFDDGSTTGVDVMTSSDVGYVDGERERVSG